MIKTNKPTAVLSDTDGNVFAIIGVAVKALKKDGKPELAAEFKSKALSAHDYDSVIQLVMEYCDVE